MARHNKKRNTAFIYESLVREIVKQSVAKDEKKRNVAINILKESFSKNTELRKELDLYKTLLENNNLKEKVAEELKKLKLGEISTNEEETVFVDFKTKITQADFNEIVDTAQKIDSSIKEENFGYYIKKLFKKLKIKREKMKMIV